MRHISIRRIRTLILLLFASIVIILTFSALSNKNSVAEDPTFVDTLGNSKDLKGNKDTGIIGDDIDL